MHCCRKATLKKPHALRAPPAFQVYASDELAREQYFGLSLAERGLLDAMRRACWVSSDVSVPASPAELAVVVRRPQAEVQHALSAAVLAWFEPTCDGHRLVDPDLRKQMGDLMDRREAQSKGAEATNNKRWKASLSDSPSDSVGVSLLSREEKSRNPFQGPAEITPITRGSVHRHRPQSTPGRLAAIQMPSANAEEVAWYGS